MSYIPNVKLTTKLPDGSRLKFRARTHKGFLLKGVESAEHERVIFNYYRQNVKAGMTVLDVGANIGIHTLQLGHLVGKEGHVIAFEPEPENLSLLYENIELNSLTDRVTVVEKAVDSATGQVTFWRDRVTGATGSLTPKEDGNTFGHTYGGRPPETTTVQATSIDDWLRDAPQLVPWLVKIDVEGAEARVISGMRETIARQRPRIILDAFGLDSADLLWSQGYVLHDLMADRRVNPGEPLPFTALAHPLADEA